MNSSQNSQKESMFVKKVDEMYQVLRQNANKLLHKMPPDLQYWLLQFA